MRKLETAQRCWQAKINGLSVRCFAGYNFMPSDIPVRQTLNYHRIIEAFKFAYAKRSELGDEDYIDVTDVGICHD
jgi:gamma-glutamyltranspeptidase/glutathione hydrolase/leukotriene-C4 hydrolase